MMFTRRSLALSAPLSLGGGQGPYDLGAHDKFTLTLEPRDGVSDEIGPTRVLEAVIPTPKPRD